MAVKKKPAPKKKAPPKRRPVAKSTTAAAPAEPVRVEAVGKVSPLGKFIVVLAFILLALILLVALRKHNPAPAPAAATSAATPAPVTTPPASSSAKPGEAQPGAQPSPAPAKAKAKAKAKDDTAIPAASIQPRLSGIKSDDQEQGKGVTLKSGASMTLRCWRRKSEPASLDVFGPHNKAVAHLSSDPGQAGWVPLTWKAQDDQGQALAPGTYYLRPSTGGVQRLVSVEIVP